jgi:hypothetical protein
MSESSKSAEENHLKYEHYRLCFWIGFLILGMLLAPVYVGWSFKPKPIITMIIGTLIYFLIGGTIGGLTTMTIGYPLNLLCEKLSWTREERRWFLALSVPFVTTAFLMAFFTHRNFIWEPAADLLSKVLPVCLLVGFSIFIFDKTTTKTSPIKFAKVSSFSSVFGIALGIAISGFIAICYFGPMNRGTPKLYDYATTLVEPSRLRTSNGNLPAYTAADIWFLEGEKHYLDDKLVDMPNFNNNFSDTVPGEWGPIQLQDGRILQIKDRDGQQICVLKSSGSNDSIGPQISQNRTYIDKVLLDDGRVLFIGGLADNKPTGTIERFDPKTMLLTNVGHLEIPRYSHTLVKLHSGNVLAIGGKTSNQKSDSGEKLTSTIELIDTKTMTSKIVGQLHKARTQCFACPLDLDKALIFGGHFLDEATDMKELGGLSVREFELYTGKTTCSPKGTYPPELWLWSIIDSLRSINRTN